MKMKYFIFIFIIIFALMLYSLTNNFNYLKNNNNSIIN